MKGEKTIPLFTTGTLQRAFDKKKADFFQQSRGLANFRRHAMAEGNLFSQHKLNEPGKLYCFNPLNCIDKHPASEHDFTVIIESL